MRAKVKDMDSFWLRIFSLQDSGMAFEDDLKLAWLLAERDHLPTLIEMTEHFTTKCSKGSFGSFRFGSVMMRTCYLLNSPDVALDIYKSEVLQEWLKDTVSNIVLMDLLIETGHFSDAVEVFESLHKREWFYALRNPLIPILYAIALYKQGSADSFEKAHLFSKKLVTKLIYKQKVEDIIAAFALKVKQANIASNLVERREENSELSWNIMVQAKIMQSQSNALAILEKLQKRNTHHLYKDTLAAIQTTFPDFAQSLKVQPINLTVEEQVCRTILIEEKEDIIPQRKRFF